MANLRVKLRLFVYGYTISITTVTGVEESEVYGYGELAELQLSTGERYLAGATVAPEEPGDINIDEDAGEDVAAIEPMGDYWCYRVIPIEDGDVELVEYDEAGNVVPELSSPVTSEVDKLVNMMLETEKKEKEKEKQNDETE